MDPHVVRSVVAEVEAGLAEVPEPAAFYTGSWIEAKRRRDGEIRRLVVDPLRRDRGLQIVIGDQGAHVTMLGISASSPSGATGALQQWAIKARLRADEDA